MILYAIRKLTEEEEAEIRSIEYEIEAGTKDDEYDAVEWMLIPGQTMDARKDFLPFCKEIPLRPEISEEEMEQGKEPGDIPYAIFHMFHRRVLRTFESSQLLITSLEEELDKAKKQLEPGETLYIDIDE